MKNVSSYALGFFLLLSCSTKENLTGGDYELFKNTPAWELAKAVRDEDQKGIAALVSQHPKLINYQEPKYGNTLLMLTVMNQQKKSFLSLLDLQADISIHNSFDGSSALIMACEYRAHDLEFIETLLKRGANPSDVEIGPRAKGNSTRQTPLMVAGRSGSLEAVELLVRNGADIKYQNEYKQSALTETVMEGNCEIALYLLKQGADYQQPIFFRPEQNRDMYLVDVLREYFFPLNSPEHTQKMEVVEFLKSKGIDYWSAPVPDFIKKKAQEQYPDTWTEYLKKY